PQAFHSGNGHRYGAVLTITGQTVILSKETESRDEMGTEVKSKRCARARHGIPLGQKSRSTIRESLVEAGFRSLVTSHASSWLRALATSTSPRETISPRRTWGTFSKVVGFVVKDVVGWVRGVVTNKLHRKKRLLID
ncbi:unnamed protein product, partial [Ectocarpus sp. 13 AM-2016]